MKFKWFQPMQFNFATTPTLTDGGGAPSGAGGGTPGAGAGGGGGQGAAPPPGQAAPPSINWETAPQHFREGYNKLKSEHEALAKQFEPWKGLNVQPGDIARFQSGYQQVYSELSNIANTLNIAEAEVADAIKTHGLLPVLDQLRYEAEQAELANQGDPNALSERDLDERIRNGIDAATRPIVERENMRLVHEGNALVERTVTDLATQAFKTAGMDWAAAEPALKEFWLTGVTEALKYDDDALKAIKFEGKTAGIQRAFQTFQAMFDAAYLARRKMEGGVAPPARLPQRPGQQPTAKQPSLDEMLNNPDVIRTSQGKPAYST